MAHLHRSRPCKRTAGIISKGGSCCGATPKEHLGLPGARNRDDEIARALAALNWEKHFELAYDPATARALHDEDMAGHADCCAMCGRDKCAKRISEELPGFAAGKDPNYQPKGLRSKPSRPLNAEELEILAPRGTLPACHKAAETRSSGI